MIKSKNLMEYSVIFIVWGVYFSYIRYVQSDALIPIISFLMLLLYYFSKKIYKINMTLNNIIWLVCCCMFIITSLYSINIKKGISFSIIFTILIIIKILLEQDSLWIKYYEKYMLVFAAIHIMSTLIYNFYPNLINSINNKILSLPNIQQNINLMNQGANAGITGQTGTNATFITYGIGIIFCIYITTNNRNKKKFLVVSLVLSLYSLFLTAKRGVLIVNISTILCITCIYLFSRNNNFKKNIIKIVITLIVCGFVIIQTPGGHVIIDKFIATIRQGDILSGRGIIYTEALNYFYKFPIFGSGLWSLDTYIGDGAHNIYIQILAENGIIGLVIFITAAISSIVYTIKLLKKIIRDKYMSEEYRRWITISIYLQLVFLLYGIMGNTLYDFRNLTPYILSIGTTYSISKNINNKAKLVINGK